MASSGLSPPSDGSGEYFASRRPPITPILAVTLQLGLLLLVLRVFHLESRGLLQLVALAAVGFPLHSVLPHRFRLPFFVALSLGGLGLVLGAANALWLAAIGGALIAVTYLPVPFPARVAAIVAIGSLLAALRARPEATAIPVAIWPILGALFMFRMIVYLYDLRHAETPPAPAWALGYFFLLPNVCFPLFPVVDFRKFRSCHYDKDAVGIYQRGARWMLRGAIHLLLYRLVYLHFTIDPAEVDVLFNLVRFILSAFLLYLRVSGQFHLAVGMLLLFGFNLPRTNRLYYLASSFTDFWRRINIYWKDFMLKVFYYPAFFRLRNGGQTRAMILATVVVFAATWLLHAYQWFWLRGAFLLEWHDTLFWTALGGLVVANSLWEARHGARKSLRARSWTASTVAVRALTTLGTFTTIALLWSLWSSDSLTQWIGLLKTAGATSIALLALAPACFLAAWSVDRLPAPAPARRPAPGREPAVPAFWPSAGATGGLLLLLLLAGQAPIFVHFGSRTAALIQSLTERRLNPRDLARLERGYYENLLDVGRHNPQLEELYEGRPADWKRLDETDAWRATDTILGGELVPNARLRFKRATLSVNRWGMRDQDYDRARPPGIFRIAVLGSSHAMGSGVDDGKTFEALLEDRLNRQAGGFEVLNFAAVARSMMGHLFDLENRVLQFEPDLVLVISHQQDELFLRRDLARVMRDRVPIPYPRIAAALERSGVGPSTADAVIQKRLEPRSADLLAWCEARMAELCRENGIIPVWTYLPMIYERPKANDLATAAQRARDAGFLAIDIASVYDQKSEAQLRIAPWDLHPNARAHALIADRLHDALVATGKLRANETR